MAILFSAVIGTALGAGVTLPILGELPAAYLPLVAFSGLLGIADSFREPASMALFADEGTDDGGVASSFGIRELVWRPGSVAGPLIAGWLMIEVNMASVFYVGGAFAITGVLAFLAIPRTTTAARGADGVVGRAILDPEPAPHPYRFRSAAR